MVTDRPLSIAWLAPQLPGSDRDGGGKRMFEMIKTLRNHGHEIHVWARDADDPRRYGAALGDLGVVWHGTTLASRDGWCLTRPEDDLLTMLQAHPWDAVVISFPRLATLLGPVVRRRCPSVPVLVDNADLHYLRRSRMTGPPSARWEKRTELSAYAHSDGVIVASDVEAQLLAAEIPRTPVVTYTVGPAQPQPGPPLQRRHGAMFLGALTHPPNGDAVRWWADEIGPAVAADLGRILPLRVFGTGTDVMVGEIRGQRAPHVDLLGWAPTLATAFDSTRVFVAPLRFGAGTKSKILDGLTHGVPIVTTSMGTEGFPDYIRHACEVADDAKGFAAHVSRLLTDDDHWSQCRSAVISAGQRAWSQQQEQDDRLQQWINARVAGRS